MQPEAAVRDFLCQQAEPPGQAMAPVERQRVPEDRIYNGCSFLMEELAIIERAIANQRQSLEIAIHDLTRAFSLRNMVEVKLAAERASAHAADVERTAAQIKHLSNSMSSTFGTHLNRRTRV